MDNVNLKQLQEDHDRGVRIETKVDILIGEVKELKDGTAQQISQHETRIKALEDIVARLLPIGPGTPYDVLAGKVNNLLADVMMLKGDDKYNNFKQKFIWAGLIVVGGLAGWFIHLFFLLVFHISI